MSEVGIWAGSRLEGGRQSCIDEPARGAYVSPRSGARSSVPANSGSAVLMNPALCKQWIGP